MATASLYIEASTQCPRCQQPIPLNGASESVLCTTCQTPLPTPPELWQGILGEELGEITGLKETEGRASTKFMGSSKVQMKYGRLAARCAKCKTTFPDAGFPSACLGGQIPCGKCGVVTRIRRAPAWLTAIQPLASWLVAEALPAAVAAPEPAKDSVVSIHCIQCGAPLQIDGKERLFHCRHCNGQVYLPDDLWLRLHPATTVEAWFVVLDLGSAVGVLTDSGPNGVERPRALLVDPAGNFVLAYDADDKGEAGHKSRIACFDRLGRMLWVQDGIEFSDHVALVPSPLDGNLLLVDRQTHTGRWIRPVDGQPLRTIGDGRPRDPSEESRALLPPDAPFDAFENRGVAIDYDGSILVLRRWGGRHRYALRRFAPDGRAVPLWPVPSAGMPSSDSGWAAIPHAPQAAPDDDTRVFFGWDGHTYFVGTRALAKLTRDGRLLGVVSFPETLVKEIVAFGADRSGMGYALFEHAERIGDTTYVDVMRIGPDGRSTVWLGPHALASPAFIGEDDDFMTVSPDGTLVLLNGTRVRIIASNGATLWQSPEAIASLPREKERLAKKRAPKRVARDVEG